MSITSFHDLVYELFDEWVSFVIRATLNPFLPIPGTIALCAFFPGFDFHVVADSRIGGSPTFTD